MIFCLLAFINDPDLELARLNLLDHLQGGLLNIIVQQSRQLVVVRLILFRVAKEFDRLDKFVIDQFSARPIAPLQPHLTIAILVERLAHKVLKPLLRRQPLEALHRDSLGLLLDLFLVTQLPEPLVDLTLAHFQLAGQLASLFARRHFSLVLPENLPHHLHLLRFLPLTPLYLPLTIIRNIFFSNFYFAFFIVISLNYCSWSPFSLAWK